MKLKKFVKIFLILLITLIVTYFVYSKFFKNKKDLLIEKKVDDLSYATNIINDVEYNTKDSDGNEYIIQAKKGEIDFSNSNILYLTSVYAQVKLKNMEEVVIISDFGKFNSESYDTIFSKNVLIDYLDNKITGDYLDFSIERNSMIMSKNVIYKNKKSVLNADVVELNIKTKDTKIYMHEQKKKVNIKNIE